MVNYLIRTVIQTGCLASGWAIVELVTRFSLSNNLMTYRLFDITSGAVYTHVSGFLGPSFSLKEYDVL